MKNKILLLATLLVGASLLFVLSCGEDSLETCEDDEICTDKSVTACCTLDKCVYKYDGKVYTESQEDQLAEDLGCSTTKSLSTYNDLEQVKAKLKTLMERARENQE